MTPFLLLICNPGSFCCRFPFSNTHTRIQFLNKLKWYLYLQRVTSLDLRAVTEAHLHSHSCRIEVWMQIRWRAVSVNNEINKTDWKPGDWIAWRKIVTERNSTAVKSQPGNIIFLSMTDRLHWFGLPPLCSILPPLLLHLVFISSSLLYECVCVSGTSDRLVSVCSAETVSLAVLNSSSVVLSCKCLWCESLISQTNWDLVLLKISKFPDKHAVVVVLKDW